MKRRILDISAVFYCVKKNRYHYMEDLKVGIFWSSLLRKSVGSGNQIQFLVFSHFLQEVGNFGKVSFERYLYILWIYKPLKLE